MPKKVCPNGHVYDSSIYGEECPLCPKGSNDTYSVKQDFGMPPFNQVQGMGEGTQVTPPGGAQPLSGGAASPVPPISGDACGATQVKGQQVHGPVGGGTIIRQPKGAAAPQGRKLVGFLVTYNRCPQGKSFNIYEGKNFVGRDASCDISVPEDNQMSSRHMSILYRNVDNKFKYRDEQSSNGTFVNKELSDEGELQNYDIIRLGSTVFIFIAIPKLM